METEERHPKLVARISEGFYPFVCVGPGWDQLVSQLDTAIAEYTPDYKIQQVKEKFGGLRYYIDYQSVPEQHRDAVQKLVDAAEHQSTHICEVCGAEGSLDSIGGWWSTLCPIHMKERADARAERQKA